MYNQGDIIWYAICGFSIILEQITTRRILANYIFWNVIFIASWSLLQQTDHYYSKRCNCEHLGYKSLHYRCYAIVVNFKPCMMQILLRSILMDLLVTYKITYIQFLYLPIMTKHVHVNHLGIAQFSLYDYLLYSASLVTKRQRIRLVYPSH